MTYRDEAAAVGANLLQPVVRQALLKAAAGLLGGAEDELARRIFSNSQEGLSDFTSYLLTQGVTVNSDDAALDTAINQAEALAAAKASWRVQ